MAGNSNTAIHSSGNIVFVLQLHGESITGAVDFEQSSKYCKDLEKLIFDRRDPFLALLSQKWVLVEQGPVEYLCKTDLTNIKKQ
jgi:hypothetical protein